MRSYEVAQIDLASMRSSEICLLHAQLRLYLL